MPTAHPAVLERVAALLAEPATADPMVDAWLRRFRAIADRSLRRTVLRSCLEEADDGTLLGTIPRLEARAESGDAGCRWMITELALTPSVVLELPYDRLAELYVAATAAGQTLLARRFLHDRPRPDAPDAEDNPALDRSAGERTALARTRNRLTIDRLVRDRDPRVIAVLLDNPVVTERDVIRIAATRPAPPEVLQLIAAHPRWPARYSIRKALAFNPYTPTTLARHLLPTLLHQDLVLMAGSHVLAPDLRADVVAFLAAHPRPGGA